MTIVVAALPYAGTWHPNLSPHPASTRAEPGQKMEKGKKRKLQTGCKGLIPRRRVEYGLVECELVHQLRSSSPTQMGRHPLDHRWAAYDARLSSSRERGCRAWPSLCHLRMPMRPASGSNKSCKHQMSLVAQTNFYVTTKITFLTFGKGAHSSAAHNGFLFIQIKGILLTYSIIMW